jgi:Ni/Co efflux regulator RcnB
MIRITPSARTDQAHHGQHRPTHHTTRHHAPARHRPAVHRHVEVHRSVHVDVHRHIDVHHSYDHNFRNYDHHHTDWRRGSRYYGPRVVYRDWGRYHLRRPPPGYEWVREGNRLVLIAAATGIIAELFSLPGY